MSRYLQILLLFIFFCNGLCFGQTSISVSELSKKEKKKYKEANTAYRRGEEKKTKQIFLSLLKKHPGLVEVHIRLGEIEYENKNLAKAEEHIETAIALDSSFHIKLFYTLATIQRDLEKYESASQNYSYFLRNVEHNSVEAQQARRNLKNCEFAVEAMKNPRDIELFPLSPEINTDDSEYMVSLDIDNHLLLFTRRIHYQEDFYASRQNEGGFDHPQAISELNTHMNEGAHCLSPDGKTLFFTACQYRDSYGSCDLYYSRKVNNKWLPPKNMGATINSRAWEGQPSISSDGHTLIFSSDRPGGMGGKDLWMAKLSEGRRWLKPVNLGPVINTELNESSPFIHADGKTLYFRSEGHPGMGKNDIFKSTWNKTHAEFSVAENLGYPINTKNDEGALTISPNGKWAFFAKEMESPVGRNHLDIFKFLLPENLKPESTSFAKLIILDSETKTPVNANVWCMDNLSKDTLVQGDEISPVNNFISVPTHGKYFIQVMNSDYLYYSEFFSPVFSEDFSRAREIVILLNKKQPIPNEASKPVILKNIFFDSGSDKLLPESYAEIYALSAYLTDNESFRIQIIGHTDDRGEENSNMILSQNRAKSVYNALVDTGLDPERISYLGKGEMEPIDRNDSESGRQNNRRTEFVIIEY